MYELERQTDNDNEPDADIERLWDRDTEDLGALEVFHFISFHMVAEKLYSGRGLDFESVA